MFFAVSNLHADESVSIHAEKTVFIHSGFGTGKDYLQMGDLQKDTYVRGVVNGMLVAPFFGAPEEKMKWFESYVETMDVAQAADLLTKYLQNNPADLDEGLNTLLYMAIREDYNKKRSGDKK
jgi:hypothetical protein